MHALLERFARPADPDAHQDDAHELHWHGDPQDARGTVHFARDSPPRGRGHYSVVHLGIWVGFDDSPRAVRVAVKVLRDAEDDVLLRVSTLHPHITTTQLIGITAEAAP